ncbi:MAG: hypothetical protein ACPK85_13905 [Methanosarcina sp.]
MLPEEFIGDEKGTIGLPIRIVVLSIIGLIGFYAILSALASAPAPLETMYAKSNISVFSRDLYRPGGDGNNVDILIKVLDRNNRGVEKANVIIWSPDRKNAYSGVTDSKGNVIIKISNPQLPPGKTEGYLSIKVMRSGFRDFANDYFIKVFKS